MIKDKLAKVFSLYNSGKYIEAQKINNEILKIEPNNVYAKKYTNLIEQKIKSPNNIKQENNLKNTIKVKGKILKCPHCLAKIPFSGLSSIQKEAIKNKNYNNLEIKCPYCNTKFSLQKRKAPSVLGLKIGDFANIDNKKYRVVGYVNYSGNWYEGNYSGKLWYLEWILLGENNDYKYFSEGGFYDDGEKTEEFELSHKITPKFALKPNYSENYILINNKRVSIKEKNIVKTKSLYGENSKIFSVGETVELYEFSFEGKDYIIEKEKVGTQSEAGIYEIKKVSRLGAFQLFGKKISSGIYGNGSYTGASENKFLNLLISRGIFGFMFFIVLIDDFDLKKEYIFYFIGIIFLFFILYKIFNFQNSKIQKFFIMLILFPIIIGISYFIFNFSLENKKEINLSEINFSKKLELKFNNSKVSTEKVVSRTKYDYGGIKTYYEKNIGLKFSVKNEEDKKILKKINEIINPSPSGGGTNYNLEKIRNMFENGKIYLIKK